MPFRVASPSCVTFTEPRLEVVGSVFGPNEPVTPWDYLSESKVFTSVSVDQVGFFESTGLSSLEGVVAYVQVDCPATGFRRASKAPLQEGHSIGLDVTIGPHEVADLVEVALSVVLDRPTGTETFDGRAFRRGSRLLPPEKIYRFAVEGSASTFPTEAFDFGGAGLPEAAAWRLNFDPESLDAPFLGSVRLLVNSSHERAQELLSGKPSLAHSVLFHGVVEQLLLTVADESAADFRAGFEEGSVGAALDHLAGLYLDRSLAEAVDFLRNDRAEALCRLQARTGFLMVGSE